MYNATQSTVEPLLWDSSIQGTQNLVREKCSHNLCIFYLEGTPPSREKGHIFWVQKTGLTPLRELPSIQK